MTDVKTKSERVRALLYADARGEDCMENELRFAVLIDADNVSDKYIKIILEETANNGIATYKRIYGD